MSEEALDTHLQECEREQVKQAEMFRAEKENLAETGFFCPKCGTVYPENEMRCLTCNPTKAGDE